MKSKSSKIWSAISHIYLSIATVIAVFPLIWIILSSIKSRGELTSNLQHFGLNHLHLIILGACDF